MRDTFLLGAVAYDPRVVTIWDGFQSFFEERGLKFDYVLYTNYERLVAALLAGEVTAAWNSPLAWLQAVAVAGRRGQTARAVVMRDTDRDLRSVVVVRADSKLHGIEALSGLSVGVGAADSPQATLLPLLHLAEAGVEVQVVRHDLLVGKHGDHIGGEREAARALMRGEVEAACLIDGNHLAFSRDGTLPPGGTRVIATTEPYDHCNFTVLDDAPEEALDRFTALLLGMSYDDPRLRPLMDLEGLKAWLPGRTEGYAMLERAVARFDALRPFLDSL